MVRQAVQGCDARMARRMPNNKTIFTVQSDLSLCHSLLESGLCGLRGVFIRHLICYCARWSAICVVKRERGEGVMTIFWQQWMSAIGSMMVLTFDGKPALRIVGVLMVEQCNANLPFGEKHEGVRIPGAQVQRDNLTCNFAIVLGRFAFVYGAPVVTTTMPFIKHISVDDPRWWPFWNDVTTAIWMCAGKITSHAYVRPPPHIS